MFIKVRRAFTVGAILLLLFLFIAPVLYLGAGCQALNERCDAMLALARAGDETGAWAAYGSLQNQYATLRGWAELFLDHRVLDDATTPLNLMGTYLQVGDLDSLAAEAVSFRQALACMLAIETGDLRRLL